jgi:hypothetical protein
VEAAGIEPSADFATSESGVCDCENCQECRAARALHFECFKSQFLASLDADVQRVVAAWNKLGPATRCVINTLCDDL